MAEDEAYRLRHLLHAFGPFYSSGCHHGVHTTSHAFERHSRRGETLRCGKYFPVPEPGRKRNRAAVVPSLNVDEKSLAEVYTHMPNPHTRMGNMWTMGESQQLMSATRQRSAFLEGLQTTSHGVKTKNEEENEKEEGPDGRELTIQDWNAIGETMGGRGGFACYQHFFHVLSPAVNTNAWTPQEEARLHTIVTRHGGKGRWQVIAKELGSGRTAWAVFTRYRVKFNRGKSVWTHEDILVLQKHGGDAARIASLLGKYNMNSVVTKIHTAHHETTSGEGRVRHPDAIADARLVLLAHAYGDNMIEVAAHEGITYLTPPHALRTRHKNLSKKGFAERPWTPAEDAVLSQASAIGLSMERASGVLGDRGYTRTPRECTLRDKVISQPTTTTTTRPAEFKTAHVACPMITVVRCRVPAAMNSTPEVGLRLIPPTIQITNGVRDTFQAGACVVTGHPALPSLPQCYATNAALRRMTRDLDRVEDHEEDSAGHDRTLLLAARETGGLLALLAALFGHAARD